LKIVLIGPGSIGKRHLSNLLDIGYKDIAVVSRSGVLPDEFNDNSVYSTVEEALMNEGFDAAFICTPTSLHIQDLLFLLKHQIRNIYIEKPLSNSSAQLNEAVELANSYSSNIVVGYDLHFEPGLQKVRELLQQKAIGHVTSANAFVGQHLIQWRSYQDHRRGMSAKREMGGGVMLDLIHEVDYLYWLFGDVESVVCSYTNTGELEIETEEAAEILLKFSGGVMATVHLDYLQPQLKRFCIFTGTKGTIYWDLADQKVTVTNMQKQQEGFSYQSFNRNDRFIAVIKTFLERPNDERLTKLPQAIKSLKIVLAAKQAAENNCVVSLREWSMVNG
jgi:predicted dehydrogenase